jgi:hypothetical protein
MLVQSGVKLEECGSICYEMKISMGTLNDVVIARSDHYTV